MNDRQGGITRRHCLAATGAGALALGLGGSGALAQQVISDIKLPDSRLARAATQFVRDTESDFLFQHSTRVYFWGAPGREAEGADLRSGAAVHGGHVP
jgi:hypothetical protein